MEHRAYPSQLDELRIVLRETREACDELLSRLREDELPPLEVVGPLESLSLIDRHRAQVLDEIRAAATGRRLRELDMSIRQLVLDALEEIRSPQTVGFLEDYLYARDLVVFRSRGVGALRRDEFRAWDRDRFRDLRRPAYIVPCLDQAGHSVAGRMARSDWSLSNRLLVPDAEVLWAAARVKALISAYRGADEDAGPLFEPLIERYATEILGERTAELRVDTVIRFDRLEQAVDERIESLEQPVRSAQDTAADRLQELDEEQQLWGVRSK